MMEQIYDHIKRMYREQRVIFLILVTAIVGGMILGLYYLSSSSASGSQAGGAFDVSDTTNFTDLEFDIAGADQDPRPRDLYSGKVAIGDDNTVSIELVVNGRHQFDRIYANYSDDEGKLTSVENIENQDIKTTADEGYRGHQVQIAGSNLKNNTTYYYQAVGETVHGERVFGRIQTFTTN